MGLDIVNGCWIVIQLLVGYNLVLPLVIFLISLFNKRGLSSPKTNTEADYAIIVTAYEQTHTLGPVVASILQLNYKKFLVYIVADKCDISQLHFEDERVIVLRPEETLSSNTKSHFYAIHRFKRPHDRLTIIDSDNLVEPDYLDQLNPYFDAGFKAVQGVRDAKNMDTMYACLDAARDIYYHFYDGKILFQAGSSATLAGSGMAFTTDLYRSCLEHQEISGAGFDKILQKEIVNRGERIAFSEQAIVYDEKTSKSDQLVKQRARWINTWFRYFKFGFGMIGNGVLKLDWNRFLFGIVLLRPPLFIFLILSLLFSIIDLLVDPVQTVYWLIGFFLFIAGFLFALLMSKTDKRIYKSLWGIPKFIFYQLLSLMKVRKANELSVATQHYHDKEINEIK
jgi:cellulose synthase/poly-beta-1,6-N-acetylglucosamine synthase-like glycosyltransferase